MESIDVCDADDYAHKLLVSNQLREPIIRSAIQALQLPSGSRGLDAGCGIGLQALLLAQAVGSTGHVTGLDLSPAMLLQAKKIVREAGLSGRISFQQGDVNKLPFDDGSFDWLWSADCAGYPAQEPVPLMEELARVVKRGGIVAIMAWSSQTLMPGYPLLEARLNATSSGIAPFTKNMSPESHHLRAPAWLRDAGLKEVEVRSFVGDVHAPLSDEIRAGLLALIEMRWPGAKSELGSEDWAEYQRLCQPASPDFILDLPGYYAFFTYSLFCARVSQS